MAHMFGSQPKVIPEFTGLQINTAVQVLPIPIIYGAPRVSVNLIYYNGFTTKIIKTGGKGALSGGKGNRQILYFATLILAIGEGVLEDIMIIYQDSNVYLTTNYPSNGEAFFDGAPGQAPWSVIQQNWPNDARPYKDLCYIGFNQAQLDASGTVPQISFVLRGLFAGSSPLNNSTIHISTGQYDSGGRPISFIGDINIGTSDADPAYVIYDFLTHPTHGAQFPAEWIDVSSLFTSVNGYTVNVGDASVSSCCQAIGLAWSVVLNNAESANSTLERWTKNLNVAPVWTGSVLKFIPYWDSYQDANPGWDSGNGIPKKYYRPQTTPLITIPLDDILQSESKDEDPITFSRKDPLEVYNTVRINFRDRNNFYNDNVAEAKDEAHIELYGPLVDNIGLANEFSLMDYAQVSATAQLRRNVGIVRTFTWRMGPLWAWLSPMDIVGLPDPTNYDSILSVRIVSLEDDEEENVTIVAEEFLPASAIIPAGGSQSPTSLPGSPTVPPNQGALNSPAPPAFPPVIVEPNADLLTALGYSTPQIIFGDSGGYNGMLDANWGGVYVWISLDGVNYQQIGQLNGPSTVGYITSPLPAYAGANPDTSDVLTVTLNISDGTLLSVDSGAAASGASLCFVVDTNGFEAISFTTATLISPFTYSLTGLYRGLYGSAARAFSAGAQFMFAGPGANFLAVNVPDAYVGKNFYIKPQSFNTFSTDVEDIADVTVYRYFVSGGGNVFVVTDSVTTIDVFALAGQFFATLIDVAVSSDSYTSVAGTARSLTEHAASSDVLSP